MTHHAVYLQTWAFIPAVILRHLQHIRLLALSQNLTFPSNYRCFSLLAVWIEAIFSWHWHMFKDKASFNYFVTFMWGLCAYACSITFHLDIWVAVMPACSVNGTCVSQHHELFSTNTSRLVQIRHGELQINLSRLWSLFRQHTATVCMFWSIFLR